MPKTRRETSILVIEDEADIRRFAYRVLDLEGYNVLQAGNGEEGMRLARNTRGLSMVLLDLKLPDRDGWLVLEDLKRDPELSSVPVLVFSVSATPLLRRKAAAMGASGYLAKPVDASGLRRAIAATVQWQRMFEPGCPEDTAAG